MIARLFWLLPEPIHTLFARLSGGWRVVALKENDRVGGGLFGHHWECWP